MSSKSLRTLLNEFSAGASQVREAGTHLSDRIKRFEAWLNKLPGRVHASVDLWVDPEESTARVLSLAKDGKEWSLYVSTLHGPGDFTTDRVLLRDASLEDKIAAVEGFPNLLENMAESQRSLVKRMSDAAVQFDAFAAEIGMKEGE